MRLVPDVSVGQIDANETYPLGRWFCTATGMFWWSPAFAQWSGDPSANSSRLNSLQSLRPSVIQCSLRRCLVVQFFDCETDRPAQFCVKGRLSDGNATFALLNSVNLAATLRTH